MKKQHRNVTRREQKERRRLKSLRNKQETELFNSRFGLNLSPEEYENAKNDWSTDDPNEPPFFVLLQEARAFGMEKEFLEGYKKVHGDIPHGEIFVSGENGEPIRIGSY